MTLKQSQAFLYWSYFLQAKALWTRIKRGNFSWLQFLEVNVFVLRVAHQRGLLWGKFKIDYLLISFHCILHLIRVRNTLVSSLIWMCECEWHPLTSSHHLADWHAKISTGVLLEHVTHAFNLIRGSFISHIRGVLFPTLLHH